MDLESIFFYLLAAAIFGSTAPAVTCRKPLYAALFFSISLLGLALLFFLLGAPLLAALEVILYAGAIMMLLLFVIMMLPSNKADKDLYLPVYWAVPLLFCLIGGTAMILLLTKWTSASTLLPSALLPSGHFGQILFDRYWPAVELVSLLLFAALVGALYFGGKGLKRKTPQP